MLDLAINNCIELDSQENTLSFSFFQHIKLVVFFCLELNSSSLLEKLEFKLTPSQESVFRTSLLLLLPVGHLQLPALLLSCASLLLYPKLLCLVPSICYSIDTRCSSCCCYRFHKSIDWRNSKDLLHCVERCSRYRCWNQDTIAIPIVFEFELYQFDGTQKASFTQRHLPAIFIDYPRNSTQACSFASRKNKFVFHTEPRVVRITGKESHLVDLQQDFPSIKVWNQSLPIHSSDDPRRKRKKKV